MIPPASRLLLVRHAPTAATRSAAFSDDEELDASGTAAAATLAGLRADRVVLAPARCCRQTAAAAGWASDTVDPRWAELDFGDWAGRTIDDVATQAPGALAAWQADPLVVAPPGGETLAQLTARVLPALAELHGLPGRTVVVSHSGPITLAVLHAVGAGPDRFWHVDVSPTSVTELVARRDGGWTLRRLSDDHLVHARPPASVTQTPA